MATRKSIAARAAEAIRNGNYDACATLVVDLLNKEGLTLTQQQSLADAVQTRLGEMLNGAAELPQSVDTLGLSVRAANCLANANVFTIGELIQRSRRDLMEVKNFGRKSLLEIEQQLAARGLRLAPQRRSRERGQASVFSVFQQTVRKTDAYWTGRGGR